MPCGSNLKLTKTWELSYGGSSHLSRLSPIDPVRQRQLSAILQRTLMVREPLWSCRRIRRNAVSGRECLRTCWISWPALGTFFSELISCSHTLSHNQAAGWSHSKVWMTRTSRKAIQLLTATHKHIQASATTCIDEKSEQHWLQLLQLGATGAQGAQFRGVLMAHLRVQKMGGEQEVCCSASTCF